MTDAEDTSVIETGLHDADLRELAATLGRALRAGGRTLAAAESCTGGWIAKAVTDTAGSSEYFAGGVVCYSDAVKRNVLGVSAATLASQGAVSEPTVAEMARGVLDLCAADIAVAVSGIAGPGGAMAGKPVGTVCFGWAWRGGDETHGRTFTRLLSGGREDVRRQTVAIALDEALRILR